MEKHYDNLKEIAFNEGALLFGAADVSGINSELKYGVSIGYVLSSEVLNTIIDSPTLIYADHYTKVNAILDHILLKINAYITKSGHKSFPVSASHIIDWQDLRGYISHRKVAYLAGMGWIGRSRLLVNTKYGSQVRYASLFTNLPLKLDKPIEGSCGKCKKCMEVCPAGAIAETSQEFQLDLCKQMLAKFAKKQGIGRRICGICVKVCCGQK